MDDLKNMQRQLDDALKLLDKKNITVVTDSESTNSANHLQLNEARSLIERCENVLDKSSYSSKPTLRIIQHFACSGGTLVSKCLAALPNVFLLSELHPMSLLHMSGDKPKFTPSDITTQARYSNIPDVDNLAWSIFVDSVKKVNDHVDELGGYLLLREHTHSEYCCGKDFPKSSSFISILSEYFSVRNVVTLRNPIDSYLSLEKNGWVHFEPQNFESYCHRLLSFLKQFETQQVFRYEDIVTKPQESIKSIAEVLKVPYSDSFIDTFSAFNITGDSGRKGDTIASRQRKNISTAFEQEIEQSSSFGKIASQYKYGLED
ncbi:hypothetical protein I533_16610 [Alteromonas mediterranea MED64]|uniref:sulfotransferase n=1 Tax=Alteromonas mediterranea TaxID=314275 RepID=UPI0003554AA6|nr:sulfotransferase [Alteromonas mediterranea]AGP83273.1 hypothetical protein I533_16610 [Alteromonas mediterranea MED64]